MTVPFYKALWRSRCLVSAALAILGSLQIFTNLATTIFSWSLSESKISTRIWEQILYIYNVTQEFEHTTELNLNHYEATIESAMLTVFLFSTYKSWWFWLVTWVTLMSTASYDYNKQFSFLYVKTCSRTLRLAPQALWYIFFIVVRSTINFLFWHSGFPCY